MGRDAEVTLHPTRRADVRGGMRDAFAEPRTPTVREIRYVVQYCAAGRDITGDFYAERDADSVRFWEAGGDPFCLLEVTRQHGDTGCPGWVATGSDAGYALIADQRFADPYDALRAQLPESAGYLLTEAGGEL